MGKTETFQIWRLRPALREKARYAPQSSAPSILKNSDYLEDGAVEATSPYHAWVELREQGRDLGVGDALVSLGFGVQVCKYAGFEEASWAETADAANAVAGSGQDATEEKEGHG